MIAKVFALLVASASAIKVTTSKPTFRLAQLFQEPSAQEIFDMIDGDGSGCVDNAEVWTFFNDMVEMGYMKAEELPS